MRAGPLAALAAVVVVVSAGQAGAADLVFSSCEAIDADNGRNSLLIELHDDRVQSFSYRRSGDLLVCDVDASRPPSVYPWQVSKWIDDRNGSDVFISHDGREVAHVRLQREDGRIEVRMIDYDRSALCGTGRTFLPVIAMRLGHPDCLFAR